MTDIDSASRRNDRQRAVNAYFADRVVKDREAFLSRLAAAVQGTAPLKPADIAAVRIEGGGVDLRVAVVDNPYFNPGHRPCQSNPRRVQAARNINESPLVRLEALRTIDAAQAAAGHKFRALVERLMSGRASPSLIQERVDGSSAGDVFTESRMRASFSLAQAAKQMTPAEFWVVHFVCGEGRSLRELDRAGRWRKGKGCDLLVASLDRLAEVWGLRPANKDARR